MLIKDVMSCLEAFAPLQLQEDYDNAGLITGNASWKCTGIICTLDVTEAVIQEAIRNKCNCIVAHHPLIFRGLKKLRGDTTEERAIIVALKNDIAVYACHTNIDNVIAGVNGKIADVIGLTNRAILEPRPGLLNKLCTFVPLDHADKVRDALFAAGAGQVGAYSECSFNVSGTGSFRAEAGTTPFVGERGVRHYENEVKIEVIVPSFTLAEAVRAMLNAHPYEEVAYDIYPLGNKLQTVGSGLIGQVPETSGKELLELLSARFGPGVVRYSGDPGTAIRKLAICGGAGSILIEKALKAGADAFVTADVKYHDFFRAGDRMLLCDIGHFESEQFTVDLFHELLAEKFPTFAVLKTEVRTNPVRYFTGNKHKNW